MQGETKRAKSAKKAKTPDLFALFALFAFFVSTPLFAMRPDFINVPRHERRMDESTATIRMRAAARERTPRGEQSARR